MVDKDKIKKKKDKSGNSKKSGGANLGKGKKKKPDRDPPESRKGSKGSKKKSVGGGSDSNITDIESTEDKIDKYIKGNISEKGSYPDDEMFNLLVALGNSLLYAQGVHVQAKKTLEDNPDNPKANASVTVAKNMLDRYVEIYGKLKVQKIAERHGYDWENDILDYIMNEQDLDKEAGINI